MLVIQRLISHTKCPHVVSNAITIWLTNNAHHPLNVYSSCYRFRKLCNLLSCNFNLSAFTFYITQMHNQPFDLLAATTSSSLRLIAYIDICTYSVAVCSILNKCPYDTWVIWCVQWKHLNIKFKFQNVFV